MMLEKKIVSIFASVLISTMVLTACGKINLPTLLVMDPAATNTLTIALPATLGTGSVVSKLVGNVDTTVTVDTKNLMSPQGVPATVKVNSFEAAGSSINLGSIASGTLCTYIPSGATAGGVAYLRPIIYQDATFKLTIPTETKSVSKIVQALIPPIPLTLNIDAKVHMDLNGLINLMLKGTGLNIHQTLNLVIPANIPLLGGAKVVLDTTLKSTKTKVTDPKLTECAGGTTTVTCGDGKVGTGETCDTAIAAGSAGACPTACTAPDACHTSTLTGSACTTQCVVAAITPCCGNGTVDTGETCDTAISGSCPTSCTAPDACHTSVLSGSACTAKCTVTAVVPCCGNGIVDAGETCDTAIAAGKTGACPTSCNDNNACTTDAMTGSACTVACTHTAIVPCCGNGTVETGETCDPVSTCPTSCDDGNKCTTDTMTGSAAACTAKCTHTAITPCCGNGTVETGETCDGNCPTSCDDSNVCTTDTLTGSAALCTATCTHAAIANCCIDVSQCNDANACTTDTCVSNRCVHTAISGCSVCTSASQCDDSNACTTDTCVSGSCVHTAISGCNTCTGPNLDGTWIAKLSTTGTITAPSPVGTLTGSTISVIQRMVISTSGTVQTAKFEMCSLSTVNSGSIPFSTDYSTAVLATMTATATQAYKCYAIGDTVAFPAFQVLTGWTGAATAGCSCPAPPSTVTSCCGAVDTDADGTYGITLPVHLFGGALNLTAYAGLTMNISLANMVLTNATTNVGTTSFPTTGYIFGSTAGATGTLNVVPDSSTVPVTAVKLDGDVPCSTVLTHCTGTTCTRT